MIAVYRLPLTLYHALAVNNYPWFMAQGKGRVKGKRLRTNGAGGAE